jgi:pimeloyl-ACP methyl ester carboxylesterase
MVNNVILVHGAWADGSSWAKVIPGLLEAGLNTVAVQLPLTSLAEDAAVVGRALARVDGSVLLVGHSYGGAVITEAGIDAKVTGLVFVAAFAPDRGESASTLGALVPASPAGAEMRPDQAGFLKLTTTGVQQDFAQDLSSDEKKVMAVTQGPTSVNALGGKVTAAGWRGKPCWYVRASEDRTIPHELQQMMAKKIGADILTLHSSHVPMLSQPAAVVELIVRAARSS